METCYRAVQSSPVNTDINVLCCIVCLKLYISTVATCLCSKERCICHPCRPVFQECNSDPHFSGKMGWGRDADALLQLSTFASTACTRDEVSSCCFFFINSWFIGVVFLTTLLTASCRVEMQKMKVVRPPAAVARYTMIFHNRDHGNEENRDRWVKNRFLPCLGLC